MFDEYFDSLRRRLQKHHASDLDAGAREQSLGAQGDERGTSVIAMCPVAISAERAMVMPLFVPQVVMAAVPTMFGVALIPLVQN